MSPEKKHPPENNDKVISKDRFESKRKARDEDSAKATFDNDTEEIKESMQEALERRNRIQAEMARLDLDRATLKAEIIQYELGPHDIDKLKKMKEELIEKIGTLQREKRDLAAVIFEIKALEQALIDTIEDYDD